MDLGDHIRMADYLAPELIMDEYDERVDIWSCGILLYLMITGEHPFKVEEGEEQIDMADCIVNQDVSFHQKAWRDMPDAENLARAMLIKDPEERISLSGCLEHPWIRKFDEFDESTKYKTLTSLESLLKYNSGTKLQQAVTSLIAAKFITAEDEKEFRDAFNALDEDHNGKISKAEMLKGFVSVFGREISPTEVDRMFEEADADGNGEIDFDEFIAATMDKDKFLSKENIAAAFREFDRDGNGKISLDEIKLVIGEELATD
jgi:calcium-dependent protein kinase